MRNRTPQSSAVEELDWWCRHGLRTTLQGRATLFQREPHSPRGIAARTRHALLERDAVPSRKGTADFQSESDAFPSVPGRPAVGEERDVLRDHHPEPRTVCAQEGVQSRARGSVFRLRWSSHLALGSYAAGSCCEGAREKEIVGACTWALCGDCEWPLASLRRSMGAIDRQPQLLRWGLPSERLPQVDA